MISEVKRLRARLVLGSGTAWEYLRVLSAFCLVMPCSGAKQLLADKSQPEVLTCYLIGMGNIHLARIELATFSV